MLIKLTLSTSKVQFYMRAKDVRTIEKDARDQITTMVTTDIFTQQGPLAYRVMETVDEVAALVGRALENSQIATHVPAPLIKM